MWLFLDGVGVYTGGIYCGCEKKRAYEQRIRDMPLSHPLCFVLSTTCTGRMGQIATTFYKRLADRLASKWNLS